MITLLKTGLYRLSQTKVTHSKLLSLDDKDFIWIRFEDIGEILVHTIKQHPIECELAEGSYKIYGVKEEPNLNDNLHLELQLSNDEWQGYLLLTGLPTKLKKRSRIIPTKEKITGNNYKLNERVRQLETINTK